MCSGAFLGAAAGLLQGRRVTTHWARANQLAEAHPGLHVDPDPIYIRDGRYWSSAGVTAGIDLSLALVQEDLGVDVAQTVARWLVMFLHRPGGQTQFASPVSQIMSCRVMVSPPWTGAVVVSQPVEPPPVLWLVQ